MRNIKRIAALSILIILSACSKNSIRGGGNTMTQERSLPAFTSIQGNADIKIHIAHGLTAKTEVHGYENLIGITETGVVNGKLTVNYKNNYYTVRNSNIELYVILPALQGISTNGSGNMTIDGFMNDDSLDARINGSSNITVSNSRYKNALLDLNGSGDIKANGLLAETTNAIIHGSGDIEISCSQKLKARIYGSGDIRYRGNPALDVEVSGSGKIIKQY